MLNQIKLSVALLFLIIMSPGLHSQEEEYSNKGRFYIAPDLGLMFGTITYIEVSPAVGYYLSDRLSIAGGCIYEYYKQSFAYEPTYETSIYGPKAYTRFTLVKNIANILPVNSNIEILAHLEYEALNLENNSYLNQNHEGRYWYHTALVGGGISQNSSPRIRLNALVLWDMDTSSSSPNSNPIIRVGIQIMLGKIYSDY